MAPPDGTGEGHFKTVAELRAAVADHERRLQLVERDVIQLADIVFGGRRVKRPRRRNPKR
jgi:hypothetical protein